MARKTAAAIALLLAIPIVAFPGWIALNRTDLASPDDADLHGPLTEIADEENGFPLLAAAAAAVEMEETKETWERLRAFRAGETWEPDWILELVARNERATALLHSSLALPHLRFPTNYDFDAISERTELLLRIQQLLRLAGAQARIELRRGNTQQAIDLATLGTHAARAVSAAENIDLLDIVMAGSYQTRSLYDLEHVVRTAQLSRSTAHDLTELLESSRWTPAAWRGVWAYEYRFVKAAVTDIAATHEDLSVVRDAGLPGWAMRLIPVSYLWQPNRTLSELARLYRDQMRKSESFCADARLLPEDEAARAEPAVLPALLLPNSVGRLSLEISRPDFDRFQLRRCHVETRVSLAQALIAAKAYWHEQGRLPEELIDLVPRYLPEVPLDRYDGAPLRYCRAKQRVYSIGDDFEDAGGSDASDASDRAEPSLSLAFSSAATHQGRPLSGDLDEQSPRCREAPVEARAPR